MKINAQITALSLSPNLVFKSEIQKLSPKKILEPNLKPKLGLEQACPFEEETSKYSEFERVFCYFDEDGDGKISALELWQCARLIGGDLSKEEAEAVVDSFDSDGDGLLGFEDFVGLMKVEGEEEKIKDLKEAFGLYEMDGSGCITPKSLRRMLSRLGEKKTVEECTIMINQFDLNGDGVICFEEFKFMMI